MEENHCRSNDFVRSRPSQPKNLQTRLERRNSTRTIRLTSVKSSTNVSCQTRLTPAERAKNYRDSLKKNPRKLSEYRQREKDRKRLSWKKRTEAQIIEDRMKARERQKRFREKRKMMGVVTEEKSKKKKVLTKSETEKQREYWRRKQAESRERRSSQKHRRYKEKDRHYRQERRNNTGSQLKRAKRKMNFPKDPEEFVNAVEDLVHNITPRKREIMKEKNLLNTPTSRKKLMFFEKSFEVLKNSNKKNDCRLEKQKITRNLSFLKKYRLSTMLARFLGVSDSYISKQSIAGNKVKQLRRDATSKQNKKLIQD